MTSCPPAPVPPLPCRSKQGCTGRNLDAHLDALGCPPGTPLEASQNVRIACGFRAKSVTVAGLGWWALLGSNQRPRDYESPAVGNRERRNYRRVHWLRAVAPVTICRWRPSWRPVGRRPPAASPRRPSPPRRRRPATGATRPRSTTAAARGGRGGRDAGGWPAKVYFRTARMRLPRPPPLFPITSFGPSQRSQ